MALEERAMLVRLSVSQWYKRALDRKVAEEVATKYEVSFTDSQDLYIKTLLPKVAMRNVNRAISELRTFHYANTLPWQDDSVRIISSAAFFSYQRGMLERKMTLETEVEQLVANYPSWLKHARETKKGLFDESQYPSAQTLRAAFGVRITFLPFPHVDDFRVQGLSEEQIADIKAQTKAELTATLSQASQNLIDRIYERLYTLYQALEPEKVFRDNTVTSVQETVELVERLNIADDERVNLTCNAVRTEMGGAMIPLLRSDPTYRLRVRAQVAELLNTINPNYKDTKQ